MSQNPTARRHGLQPQLPLVEADGADAPAAGTGPEWHLDEHTREVGRRGIAAARARLRSRAGASGTDGARRHPPGRAA